MSLVSGHSRFPCSLVWPDCYIALCVTGQWSQQVPMQSSMARSLYCSMCHWSVVTAGSHAVSYGQIAILLYVSLVSKKNLVKFHRLNCKMSQLGTKAVKKMNDLLHSARFAGKSMFYHANMPLANDIKFIETGWNSTTQPHQSLYC